MYRVLYVDDEKELLILGKLFLELSQEFTISTSSSAQEVLKEGRLLSYDAIISDYQMPEMDGIAFLKEVRSRFGDIPFILFTGKGREEVVIEAINNGADFYLQKGSDSQAQFAELMHKIRMAVERKRVHAALKESEAVLQSMLDAAPVGIVLLFNRRMQKVNHSLCAMTGYSEKELTGQDTRMLYVDEEEYLRVGWELYGQMERKGRGTVESRLKRKDDAIINVILNLTPVDPHDLAAGVTVTVLDITERKRIEKALASNGDYLNQIFSTVREGIVIIDARTHEIIDLNPAAATMIGATRDQILHTICHRFICPAEQGRCPITDLHQNVDNSERMMLTADGKNVHIIKYVVPFTFHGRECLLETILDNTERKKAEDELHAAYEELAATEEELRANYHELTTQENALRASEEKYRLLTEVTNDIIYMIDTLGTITHISPQISQFGYTPEDVLSHNFTQFLAEEDVPKVTADLEKTLSTRKPTVTTLRIRDKSGNIHWMEDNGAPVLDSTGSVVAISGILRNITERKKVEVALQKSEEKFRTWLESLPDYIIVHREGRILYFNPACAKGLGYSREKLLNQSMLPLIAPEFQAKIASAIRKRMAGETIEPYEIDIFRGDGTRRTVILNGNLVDFDGAPASLNLLTDITERKRAEDALAVVNRKLHLLSSITRHDILNQLTALLGYIDLSTQCINNPGKMQEFIAKELNATNSIRDQILFTRDYQGMGVEVPDWHNVSESIRQAIARLHTENIVVRMEKCDVEVLADPLFEKVFYNLIDNAFHYGGDGMTTIQFSCHESNNSLTIVCEDNGVGITGEDKKRLFSKGFGKNTGLGLFLSREILSISGIAITENGMPGKGARFEITVPKGGYRFRECEQK